MPDINELKRGILVENGLDPEKYDFDADYNVIEKPAPPPAPGLLQQVGESIGAGAAHAAYNLPQTAGGLAGGAIGGSAGVAIGVPAAAALFPESGPAAAAAPIVSGMVGSGLGAAGGAWLGRQAQEQLYPQDWQAAEKARVAAHPDAAKVADIITMLAAIRPSLKAVKNITGLVRNLRTGARPNAAQVGEVANIGGNVAMNAGMNAAGQLWDGKPFDPKEVFNEALLGALQHRPTKLGRALSFGTLQPHGEAVDPRDLVQGLKDRAAAEQASRAEKRAADDANKNNKNSEFVAREAQISAGTDPEMAATRAELARVTKEAEELRLQEQRMAHDFERARMVDPALFTADGRMEAPDIGLPPEPPRREQVGGPTDVNIPLDQIKRADVPGVDKPTVAQPGIGEAPRADIVGDKTPPNITAPPRTQGFDAREGVAPTREWLDYWKQHLKETGAADLTEEPLGKLAGEFTPRADASKSASVRVDPQGYTHTAPHEGLHGMINDTLRFGSPEERGFLRKNLEKLGIPQDENGLISPEHEEKLVQQLGEDVVSRIIKPETHDRYEDDRAAWLRYKKGEHTPADAQRLLSNRYLRDRGLAASVARAARARVATGVAARRKLADELDKAPMDKADLEPATPDRRFTMPPVPKERVSAEQQSGAPAPDQASPEIEDYWNKEIARRAQDEVDDFEASAEDLEHRRVEDRLSGRDRSRYQGKEVDAPHEGDVDYSGGADIEKLIKLLRNKQDRGNTTEVAGRELIQNSVDALRSSKVEKPGVMYGAYTEDGNNQFAIIDNAKGMSPKFLITKFLKMGYSSKGVGDGGGFGIAKGQFLGNSNKFLVRSLWTDPNDGARYMTELRGNGDGFTSAQKPFRPKFDLNEEHEINPDLHYSIEKVNENPAYHELEDGTFVNLHYNKDTSGSAYAASAAANKTMQYNQDIGVSRLVPEKYYSKKDQNPFLRGTDFYNDEPLSKLSNDVGVIYNKDTKKWENPRFVKHEDIELPSTKINVFSTENEKPHTGTWHNINVLLNGIHQFNHGIRTSEDVTMPPISINLQPKVGAGDKNYPMSLDRSQLSGEAEEAINRFFENLGAKKHRDRLNKYRTALNKAPTMEVPGARHVRLLDTSSSVPPETVKDIANSKEIALVARTLGDIHDVIARVLHRRYPKEGYDKGKFTGIFMGTEDAYGVRFGSETAGSEGQMYYDPFLMFEKAKHESADPSDRQEVLDRWLGQAVGVALHENLHQNIHTEGEGLARGLTFKSGDITLAHDIIHAALSDKITKLSKSPKLYDELERFSTKLAEHRSGDKASDFLSGVEGSFRGSNEETSQSVRAGEDSGTRYQTLGPDAHDPLHGSLPPEKAQRRGWLSGFSDRLRATKEPTKLYIADTLDELHRRVRSYEARYADPIQKALGGLNKREREAVQEIGYREYQENRDLSHLLAPRARAAHAVIRKTLLKMAQDQRAANHKLETGDDRNENKFYWPGQESAAVRDTINNHQNTPRFHQIKKEFIAVNTRHLIGKGMAPADAAAKAEEYWGKHMGGARAANLEDTFNFGAVSLHAGSRMPRHMVEPDPAVGFKSYVANFARARAFRDVLETDPRAMQALEREHYYDPATGDRKMLGKAQTPGVLLDADVQRGLKSAAGLRRPDSPYLSKLTRFVHTGIIGNPASKSADIITTAMKALAFTPVSEWPGLVANLKNYKADLEKSYAMGTNKRGAHIVSEKITGAGDQALANLDKVSAWLATITGSEHFERAARGLAQNTGRFIGETMRARALAGDKEAGIFLNKVSPRWRNLSHDELGSEIGLIFQGKYDATNLPDWAQNSAVAPFMKLLNWGTEQTNNFNKYAIEPASRGNLAPLLKHVVTGLLGGYVEEKLRELITGKKSRVASIPELREGSDGLRVGTEAARKINYYFQIMGLAPVYTEMSGAVLDSAAGQRPQGITWPTAEMAAGVFKDTASMLDAMAKPGAQRVDILLAYLDDQAKNTISAYRIGRNAAGRAGLVDKPRIELEESNARRDFRIDQEVNGAQLRTPIDAKSDYSTTTERKIEHERNVDKMMDMLQEAKGRARELPNRDDRDRALRALKASRISYAPSRERDPAKFWAHIDFVRRTQGDAAAERLTNMYMGDERRAKMRRR